MTDDLDAVRKAAFARLSEGASRPDSPWRQMALATVAAGGQPRVRTLVLRGFDPAALTLELHTDKRSAKFSELQANPRASLHGWNPASGEQLRIEATVSLHTGDALAHGAWAKLRPASRDTYRVSLAPGRMIAHPGEAVAGLDDAQAFAAFAVLVLSIELLEYLLIDANLHRRARFTWEAGVPAPMWLVP
jgi:hypothetical protein